jgi:hypothetical protein
MLDPTKVNDAEFQAWYAERPPFIQELVRQYPPGLYRMRHDAPYGISAPGTEVSIVSWFEDGSVTVGIMKGTEFADLHVRELRAKHGPRPGTPEGAAGHSVRVEPKYMELIEIHPLLKGAWS